MGYTDPVERNLPYLYPLSLLLALANMAEFFRSGEIQAESTLVYFLKTLLILSITIFLYRLLLAFFFRIHRGLPMASVLLYGYVKLLFADRGQGISFPELDLSMVMWGCGGILVFLLVLKALGQGSYEEKEYVPETSRHLVTLLISLGITVLFSPLPSSIRWVGIILCTGTSLLLMGFGGKIHTLSSTGRRMRYLTFILILLGIWFDVPHWPPRLQTNHRSVLLITVDGISPEMLQLESVGNMKALQYPNAFTQSPDLLKSLSSILMVREDRSLSQEIDDKFDKQAVVPMLYQSEFQDVLKGFHAVHRPGFSMDSFRSLLSFRPLVILVSPLLRTSWSRIVDRETPDATADKAIRVLNSVKEPFFIWVAFSEPPSTLFSCPPDEEFIPADRKKYLIDRTRDHAGKVGHAIRKLLSTLQSGEFFPQTQVMAIGLRGIQRFEHQRFGIFPSLYPEMLHVPMILFTTHDPESLGGDEDILVCRALPTLMTWLRVDIRESSGLSSSLLIKEAQEFWTASARRQDTVIQSIYTPSFIGIRNLKGKTFELYDRNRDPSCQTDIHLLYPDKVTELENLMETAP